MTRTIKQQPRTNKTSPKQICNSKKPAEKHVCRPRMSRPQATRTITSREFEIRPPCGVCEEHHAQHVFRRRGDMVESLVVRGVVALVMEQQQTPVT